MPESRYTMPYSREHAPKLGVVTNSIHAFSKEGKNYSENNFKAVYKSFLQDGFISEDSVFYEKRIFGYHQAQEAADRFAKANVDIIIIFNTAFPNGFVFPVIAMNAYLRNLPLIVAADVEPNEAIGSREWATNGVCGNDMNNYVAKYIGRYARFIEKPTGSREFVDELKMLLNVFNTVREMRRDYLGRFGEGPGGFHSASNDQLLFFKTFGTIVDSVDLIRVREVYDSMETTGIKKSASFSERDIKITMEELTEGRLNLLKDQSMLYKGARLYHALKNIIDSEGFTSAALRCWPEMMDGLLKITPCLSIAWALSKGDVRAFACESDWPIAVLQSIGRLLSGVPVACLDFVNWTPERNILQIGHCGVGIPCVMAPSDPALIVRAQKEGPFPEKLKKEIMSGQVPFTDAIIEHGNNRLSGIEMGPSLIGQFRYGKKTGFSILKTPENKLKMLAFTGESSPETAQGLLYSASDIRIDNYQKLFEQRREHGFPHHLALAMSDISRELMELCGFYDIQFISPDN